MNYECNDANENNDLMKIIMLMILRSEAYV